MSAQSSSSTSLKRKLSGNENLHSGPSTSSLSSFGSVQATQSISKKPRVEVVSNPSKKHLEPPITTLDVPLSKTTIETTTKKSTTVSPCPVWQPIPDCFDREYVEQLVFLREFCARFQKQLKLAKSHIDALTMFEPLSEPTCKAILVGLVDIVRDDETSNKLRSTLASVLTTLKKGKINLDDIWQALQRMKPLMTVTLGTPLPQDALDESLLTRRTTRTGPAEILHSNQLIPVIMSLMEEALHTSVIRQELDDGVKETTKLNKDRFADIKEETDRFNEIRNILNIERDKAKLKQPHDADWAPKLRDARTKHKSKLLKISIHYASAIQAQSLRFAPLGTDHSGRTYYALSHPRAIAPMGRGKSGTKKNARGAVPDVPSAAERARFGNWAYFVFVWGKKPVGAPSSSHEDAEADAMDVDDDDDETEVGDDVERWWAFSSASRLGDLSKWLSTTAAAMDEAEATLPSPAPTATVSASVSGTSTPLSELTPIPEERHEKAGAKSNAHAHANSNTHTVAMRPLCKALDDFADFLTVRLGPDSE